MMGEITRRYPRGELLVSTGQHRDSAEMDSHYAPADLLPIPEESRRPALLGAPRRHVGATAQAAVRLVRLRTPRGLHRQMGARARRYQVRRAGPRWRRPQGAPRDPSLRLGAAHPQGAVGFRGGGGRQQPMDPRAGAEGAPGAGARPPGGTRPRRAARHRPRAVPPGARHARGARPLPPKRRPLGAHRRAARALQRGRYRAQSGGGAAQAKRRSPLPRHRDGQAEGGLQEARP